MPAKHHDERFDHEWTDILTATLVGLLANPTYMADHAPDMAMSAAIAAADRFISAKRARGG